MLPVSLDCSFWFPLRCSLTFICPVSCVLYVASFSGLFIVDCPFGVLYRLFVLCLVYYMSPVSLDCSLLIAPSVFSNVYLSCLVYYMSPVSLDCSLLIAPSVFSNVYLSCVLCTICRQFLWMVHCWLPLRCSLTFICPVSCVLYVASFSGLFIVDYPFGGL